MKKVKNDFNFCFDLVFDNIKNERTECFNYSLIITAHRIRSLYLSMCLSMC